MRARHHSVRTDAHASASLPALLAAIVALLLALLVIPACGISHEAPVPGATPGQAATDAPSQPSASQPVGSQPASGPDATQLRISCVGDSITAGYGLADPQDAWVARLPGLLGGDCQTNNFGLSGRCLLSTGAMPWLDEDAADLFWETDEDVVVLMLGTNDVVDASWDEGRFAAEYEALAERILAKPGSPALFVMTPPQVFPTGGRWGQEAAQTLAEGVVPVVRGVAERPDVTLVDLYDLTSGHPEWFDDGIHPNTQGSEAIAEFVAQAIADGYPPA